jgi:uncharacterized protein
MVRKQLLFIPMALLVSFSLKAHNLNVHCPHNTFHFTVEVARTLKEQEKGLMFRKTLEDNAGMIFLYPTPRPIAMWMKNTQLSLDMIFADETGTIINIHPNATPYSLDIIGPVYGVSQVLEVKSGVVKKQNITKKCRLELDPPMAY